MKRERILVVGFTVLLSMSTIAGAGLAVVNGDFSEGSPAGDVNDIPSWNDYNGVNFWDNTWVQNSQGSAPTVAPVCVFSANAANGTVDGAGLNTYLYQAIGTSDGASGVDVSFDWGAFYGAGGRYEGMTIMILESDGSFVADNNTDVLGGAGISIVGQQSLEILGTADGQINSETLRFDLSEVNSANTLYLRFNNYEPVGGDNSEWNLLDNVSVQVVPEPATISLVAAFGAGILFIRRRSRR